MNRYKIIIITNGNYFARLILTELINRYHDSVYGIVIIKGDYKGRKGLHSAWELSKVTALPYLIYKVLSIYLLAIAQHIYPKSVFNVKRQAQEFGLPVYEFDKVNNPELLLLINSLQPDLLVSVSCPQLIGEKILNCVKLNSLNIHSSPLPAYAGLAPYFWVLSRGETETATTVHYMTTKFDKGNILVQKRIQITKGESAYRLFTRLAIEGSTALKEAVDLAIQRSEGIKQDSKKFTYYSNPTFKAYLDLRRYGHVLMRPKEILDTVRVESKKKESTNSSSK